MQSDALGSLTSSVVVDGWVLGPLSLMESPFHGMVYLSHVPAHQRPTLVYLRMCQCQTSLQNRGFCFGFPQHKGTGHPEKSPQWFDSSGPLFTCNCLRVLPCFSWLRGSQSSLGMNLPGDWLVFEFGFSFLWRRGFSQENTDMRPFPQAPATSPGAQAKNEPAWNPMCFYFRLGSACHPVP